MLIDLHLLADYDPTIFRLPLPPAVRRASSSSVDSADFEGVGELSGENDTLLCRDVAVSADDSYPMTEQRHPLINTGQPHPRLRRCTVCHYSDGSLDRWTDLLIVCSTFSSCSPPPRNRRAQRPPASCVPAGLFEQAYVTPAHTYMRAD